MDMLDGRAHCRAQLGRVDEALEDGNRMLALDKAGCLVGSNAGLHANFDRVTCESVSYCRKRESQNLL
jgi:hypothetical protein